MIKFAEIIDGRVLSIGTSDVLPVLTFPFVVVDISNYEGEVKEGFLYDAEEGKFIESTRPEPTEPAQPTSELSVVEMQAQILLNTEYLVSRNELLGGK